MFEGEVPRMGISDPSTAVAGIEYMYTGGFGICNWITLRVDDDSRDQYRRKSAISDFTTAQDGELREHVAQQ
jgi:hypothetical protein